MATDYEVNGYGVTVELPRMSAEDIYTSYGSTGLKRGSGIVVDEQLPALRGLPGRRIFQEMSTDPVISAFLFAIEKVITRLKWRMEPGDDSSEGEAAAAFVEGCLYDMTDSWDDTLSEIMTCLTFGWSLQEIIYKRRSGEQDENDPNAPASSKYDDGKIGWRKWDPRAQETLYDWVFDLDGGIHGMRQSDPWSGKILVPIPIQKALLFRTSSRRRNPEGLSVLRSAYRSWFFKKRIEELEAIGVERDLAGLPVAWVPPSYLDPAAAADVQAALSSMQDIVQNVKRNEQEGVVFPLAYDEAGHKLFDLTLLTTGGTRQFDTDAIVARYDQRIAMSVLADWLLLGHEKVGSFSLGTTKMDMWTMSVDAIAHAIASVINKHAIPRLLALNGMPVNLPPKLAYGDVASIDLTELADFVSKLVTGGVLMPDDRMEAYLREVGGLPPAENNSQHAEDAVQAEEDKAAFLSNLQGKGGQQNQQQPDGQEQQPGAA